MGQEDCGELNFLRRQIHDRLLRKNDKAAISAFFRRAFSPTPWASFGGWGAALLEILGDAGPLGFPNPEPISDQKILFSTPFFRPGF